MSQQTDRRLNNSLPSNSLALPHGTPRCVDEQVKQRAYRLYELRGARNGSAEQDWLEAEQEMIPQRYL